MALLSALVKIVRSMWLNATVMANIMSAIAISSSLTKQASGKLLCPNSCYCCQWHHVFVPYVTIPNVTIPKFVISPNIYTNPERNPEAKLGEHCPKVRLSQDRMPIEQLTQQQSRVRGKAFLPFPSLARGGEKGIKGSLDRQQSLQIQMPMAKVQMAALIMAARDVTAQCGPEFVGGPTGPRGWWHQTRCWTSSSILALPDELSPCSHGKIDWWFLRPSPWLWSRSRLSRIHLPRLHGPWPTHNIWVWPWLYPWTESALLWCHWRQDRLCSCWLFQPSTLPKCSLRVQRFSPVLQRSWIGSLCELCWSWPNKVLLRMIISS